MKFKAETPLKASKEIKRDEYRVAITPAGVRELVASGTTILSTGGTARTLREVVDADRKLDHMQRHHLRLIRHGRSAQVQPIHNAAEYDADTDDTILRAHDVAKKHRRVTD